MGPEPPVQIPRQTLDRETFATIVLRSHMRARPFPPLSSTMRGVVVAAVQLMDAGKDTSYVTFKLDGTEYQATAMDVLDGLQRLFSSTEKEMRDAMKNVVEAHEIITPELRARITRGA
jgi:hypothetical protein